MWILASYSTDSSEMPVKLFRNSDIKILRFNEFTLNNLLGVLFM